MKKIFLILLILLNFLACAKDDIFIIEGKIKIKGSSPHTYVVIEDIQNHKVYKVKNKNSFNIMHKQKKLLIFKVKLLKEAIGPDYPALVEITNIEE